MSRLITFFLKRSFFRLLVALVLLQLLAYCNGDSCTGQYDKSTCKRVREKSNELNRKASNYARQKEKLILDYHTFIHGNKQSYGHASSNKETIINPKEAWATEMIVSWLTDGNVIDVLIQPYYHPYARDTKHWKKV
jgi:hypothetical protein